MGKRFWIENVVLPDVPQECAFCGQYDVPLVAVLDGLDGLDFYFCRNCTYVAYHYCVILNDLHKLGKLRQPSSPNPLPFGRRAGRGGEA